MIKYAPYIDGTIGAFDLKHGLKVPFIHSKAIGMWDKPMTLLIKELNSEIVGMIQSNDINPYETNPSAFFNYYDSQAEPQKEGDYYILSSQQNNRVKLLPGQYYKVQLAYGAIPEDISSLTFSSVGLVKFLGYDVKVETERLDNNTFRIKYLCNDDRYELPYSYNLKFYLEDELYYQQQGYFTSIDQSNGYLDVTIAKGLIKGEYKIYAEILTTNKGHFISPELYFNNRYWYSKVSTELLDIQLNQEYGEVKISLKENCDMNDYEVYRMEGNDFSTLQSLSLASSHIQNFEDGDGKILTNLIVGDNLKIKSTDENSSIKIFGKNLFPTSCDFIQTENSFPFKYEQGQIKVLPNIQLTKNLEYTLKFNNKFELPNEKTYRIKLLAEDNQNYFNIYFNMDDGSNTDCLEDFRGRVIRSFKIIPKKDIILNKEIALNPIISLEDDITTTISEMPMDPIIFTGAFETTIKIPRKNLYIFTTSETEVSIRTITNSYVIDNTLEHFKDYKYLTINSNNIIGEVHDVKIEFEDMFLQDEDNSLRIKFNPKVSSFKINTQETKYDTIGGQYPVFYRNGMLSYAEFPISGLLSYWMGENGQFCYDYELGLEPENLGHSSFFENSTAGTFELINEIGPLEIKKEVPKRPRSTNLTHYNIAAERRYKMKVYNWLNNGKPKIFRSPTEGNFIVRLMNISLSPEDQLGRMLHTFQATAYESAEYNFENFKKYKLAFKKEEQEL